MRVPTAFKSEAANEFRQRQGGVAAHALQSTVNDRQELASNDSNSQACRCESSASIRLIADAWPDLQPHIREAIFTLIECALPSKEAGRVER